MEMKLDNVLSRTEKVLVNFDRCNVESLREAARFWVGKELPSHNKATAAGALKTAFAKPASGAAAFEKLSDTERQVLSIYARYGGIMTGNLLEAELNSRGLNEPEDPNRQLSYRVRRESKLMSRLRRRMMLIGVGVESYYNSYIFDYSPQEFALNPAVANAVPIVAALPWKSSGAPADVKSAGHRSSAEVALDFAQVAEALREMKTWHVVKGDTPVEAGSPEPLAQKLAVLPSAKQNPLSPPDPQALFYELLRQLECVDVKSNKVAVAQIDKDSRLPAAVQAWDWFRAWLNIELWQDGIGVVRDRYYDDDSSRIDPRKLSRAKELLAWALCRVASTSNVWLDLETFICDLWDSAGLDETGFYWGSYSWSPGFESTRAKNNIPIGELRARRANWLDRGGTWFANAIMVTLFTLGLIERGESAGKRVRHCFRLTDLGRLLFGAPESDLPVQAGSPRFLTVQPNHEVLAYLDTAEAGQVSRLSRIAERTSKAGGAVQTFTLRRDTVYRALESGLTLESIKSFLAEHSKTPLPENVVRSLVEWTNKRESLVLRRKVTLAVVPEGVHLAEAQAAGRTLADCSALLPKITASHAEKTYSGWKILDHRAHFPASWKTDEMGHLTADRADSVSRLRLSRIAERKGDGWQLTEDSVKQARKQGVSVEQMLLWLRQHLTHDIPPLVETAIRNWTGDGSAFLGKMHLLHVPNMRACVAILTSALFKPLIEAHLPPGWFIIQDDKVAEAKRLLRDLGFSLTDAPAAPGTENSEKAPAKKKPGKKRGSR